jgi:superfamily I DNA/RNA helicase
MTKEKKYRRINGLTSVLETVVTFLCLLACLFSLRRIWGFTEKGGRVMVSPEAVQFTTDDVTVYLAAAGAGKTQAIMNEMTSLLKTYRPDEIAFVTFTRKGVANGIERALQANPRLAADDLIHFRTLHALCFRELGLTRDSIITPDKIADFNRSLDEHFHVTLSDVFDLRTEDDKLLSRYDAIRNGSTRDVFTLGDYNAARYTRLIKSYEAFKAAKHLVDFHDCLLKFRERNRPVNVKVAFIDEAQDLTPLQWEVCQIAFSTAGKIRIAGDDFQSLFTYAGASPGTLIALSRRYRAIKLESSYRLPKEVYRFAKGITRIITDKVDKDFKPAKDVEGFVEEISDRHLLARRIGKDIADNGLSPYRWYLLFRNNCFISEVAGLLEQYIIPYHTARGFCIPEKELAKIRRYYNYRKEGFGSKDAFEKFCKEHNIKDINDDFINSDLIPSKKRYLYFDYTRKFGIEELVKMSNKEPSLLLSTTHRVKGGEADFVVVFLDCTGHVAKNVSRNIDEELRVLYVACTRARLGLFLASSRGKYGFDKVVDVVKEQVV